MILPRCCSKCRRKKFVDYIHQARLILSRTCCSSCYNAGFRDHTPTYFHFPEVVIKIQSNVVLYPKYLCRYRLPLCWQRGSVFVPPAIFTVSAKRPPVSLITQFSHQFDFRLELRSSRFPVGGGKFPYHITSLKQGTDQKNNQTQLFWSIQYVWHETKTTFLCGICCRCRPKARDIRSNSFQMHGACWVWLVA